MQKHKARENKEPFGILLGSRLKGKTTNQQTEQRGLDIEKELDARVSAVPEIL